MFPIPIPLLLTALALQLLGDRPVIAAKGNKAHRVARIEFTKECDEPKHSLRYLNSQLRLNDKGGFNLDADVHVSRGITSWKRMELNFTKCQEVVSSNTCEYFQTWKFKANVCVMIHAPDMLWSDLVAKIQPPIRCPFAPGNYSYRDVKLDPKQFALLPLPMDNTIWRVQTLLFDQDNHLHICFDTGFRFIRSRS